MADADEDTPQAPSQPSIETDLTDETQDFRFLTHLSHEHPTIPRRGEKDFEPHGTTHQASTLAASRHAMHTALSHTRLHVPKAHIIGHFDPETGMTVVERARGQHFRTMGRADAQGRVWLGPEEAVYLCERGNLDVRWPTADGEGEGVGVVMSLQGVYACLMGRGGVGLERYVVYAGLKRSGYVVLRAPTWGDDDGGADEVREGVTMLSQEKAQRYWGFALFVQIFRSLVARKPKDPPPLGPLVTPGLYRSYREPCDSFVSAHC